MYPLQIILLISLGRECGVPNLLEADLEHLYQSGDHKNSPQTSCPLYCHRLGPAHGWDVAVVTVGGEDGRRLSGGGADCGRALGLCAGCSLVILDINLCKLQRLL